MLTYVFEQFFVNAGECRKWDFRMSSLLLETGPTVILDEKSHTSQTFLLECASCQLSNRFLRIQRERAHTRAKSRVPWLTNPPEQTYWQWFSATMYFDLLCCAPLCCAVPRCVVLCSIVLCSVVVLHCVVLRCVALCCGDAPLCCATLLCCALLYCAPLCCAP